MWIPSQQVNYWSYILHSPNLLTYSIVKSPSWEANWFAASQEIPRISRNPKVHYRTHKRPPPISILDQPNPVHIPTSHLLEFHPHIIYPSASRSPQWSLYLRFPHQDPIHPPLLTHTRHMSSQSHSGYHLRTCTADSTELDFFFSKEQTEGWKESCDLLITYDFHGTLLMRSHI